MTDGSLATWLTAQLDEDQRVAEQGLVGDHPLNLDDDHEGWSAEAMAVRSQREEDWDQSWHTHRCGYRTAEFGEICECGVPSRVLAEIAAKRAILHLHARAHECSVLDERGDVDNCRWVMDGENCTTLLLLAQPHRDRPDWSSGWEVGR